MSRIKIILLSLTVVLAMGATTSASVYASPVWLVKGKTLKSSETSTASIAFGKLTIKWEDSTTKTKFEAECKKASGETELNGGEPGTDKVQMLKFKECSLVAAAKGCELTVGGVTTEELPGWSTKLEVIGEKTYDVVTGISFSLILEGCEKVSFSKTWLFRGNLKAELKNESGKIKMVFPTTAVEGDTLKSEGAEASLSGEGKLEEKVGGTLEYHEEVVPFSDMPAYTNSSGVLIAGTLAVEIKKVSGSGNAKLEGTLAGVKVVIECEEEKGAGTVENSLVAKKGLSSSSVHYLHCFVTKPAGQGCLVLNELIQTVSTTALLLLLNEGYRNDLSPTTGTAFTSILIDKCTTTALNGTFTVTGTLAAEINNATSSREFTSTSGSALKFGGNAATYIDNVQVLMEGGGKIGVENGF